MSVQVGLKLEMRSRALVARLSSKLLMVSTFAFATLLSACGDEADPNGIGTVTLTTGAGSSGVQATTGSTEQGPGAVPSGIPSGATSTGTNGGLPGTQPGVTTTGGVLPGTTTGTTGAGTSSSVDTTSDQTSTTTSSTSTTTTGAGEGESSKPGDTTEGGSDTTGPEPTPRKRYTEGHGDLAVYYDEAKDEARVAIDVQDSFIDGKLETKEFSVDELVLVGAGRLVRDANDVDNLLAGMCVEKGASLYWLPQGGEESRTFKVPFFGWASRIRPVDTDKPVKIRLVGFEPPTPEGHFSVWKIQGSSVIPKFFMSTCDGIDGDQFDVEAGHDHLSLGFTGGPGLWKIHFRAEFSLLTTKKQYQKDFSLHFLVQ